MNQLDSIQELNFTLDIQTGSFKLNENFKKNVKNDTFKAFLSHQKLQVSFSKCLFSKSSQNLSKNGFIIKKYHIRIPTVIIHTFLLFQF